jgi:hypothetical protein
MKRIYLYDKTNGNIFTIIHNSKVKKEKIEKEKFVHLNSKGQKVTRKIINYKKKLIDCDCDEFLMQKKMPLITDGGKWKSILKNLKDNKIENLGWIIHEEVEGGMSRLKVDISAKEPKIISKPYLKISILSEAANFLEKKGSKDKYSFESDGQKPLQLRVEAFNFSCLKCKPSDSDQRNTDLNLKVKVYTDRGRLCNKIGVYDLRDGEFTCNLVLPDESIPNVRIYAGLEDKDFVKSPIVFSNAILIDCI